MKKIYLNLALILALACALSSCTMFGNGAIGTDSTSREAVTSAVQTITTNKATTKTPETTKTPVTTKTPETTKTPVTTKTPETTKTPVTTKTPETTKTPVTTKTPETTKTPVTTKTPEIPSTPTTDYKDHVYLIAKDSGNCDELIGKVYVNVFLVNDTVSSWDNAATSVLKLSFAEQEKSLESDARSYGKTLDIIYIYTVVNISVKIDTATTNSDWQDAACTALGLTSVSKAQTLLEQKNGGDSNPIVFAVNKAGRAYASWNTGTVSERVTLFSSSLDSLRHELCHLYGARDFYYPNEAKQLADKHIADSLMCSGEDIDALTAYLIGWDEELDANAKAFLEETKHFTREYLKEEQNKQNITGNVTDYVLSYGVYTGYLERGVPNGKGKMIYSAGDVYEGDFVNGNRHGTGKYIWTSGNYYEGDWVNGDRTGKGTLIWTNGDKYEGDFLDGERTGKGTFTWASGAVYTGDYVNGIRTGKGKYLYTNGNVYEGDFINGARTGKGTFTFKSGDVYTGDFVDGKYHGEGTYKYSAGHVYTGKWENGARNGYGKMTWADGSTYEGEWKDNLRHGIGKYVNKSGTVFEGQWNNDVFQG